jgi:membrane-associated phospholipid phosphatase
MNPLLVALLLSALPPAPNETPGTAPSDQAAQTAQAAPQAKPAPAPEQPQLPAQGESNRSVIKPAKGQEAIKEKDLYARSGYLHPFRRMPMFILVDQKKIWTSPFHTSKANAKWWAIFGTATAGLVAADRYIERAAPDNSTLRHIGNDASYLGEAYTLLPLAAGFYLIGTEKGSDHFREAGLLSFETIADVTLVEYLLKGALGRERPYQGHGNGAFEQSPTRWNSSFPSGHTITTFAMGSVIAHEYPHHWWVSLLIYSYGAGVAGARLAANQHFPGDVFAGGVMGWFIGDYVYGKRHNPELDKKSTAQKILSHVSIGGMY